MLKRIVTAAALSAAGLVVSCGSSDGTSEGGPTQSAQGGASAGGGAAQAGKGGALGSGATSGKGGGGVVGGGAGGGAAGEVCGNGLDDNGNGLADEGCPCTLAATQTCFVGDPKKAGVGSCKLGTQTCKSVGPSELTMLVWGPCEGQGSSQAEVCVDGVDNDCNGSVDDGCPCQDGTTSACSTACGKGSQVCKAGKLGPCSAPAPATEVCNGLDDDCDGKIDGMTMPCSTACGMGTETCTAGKWSACSAKAPAVETCNGVDDDCDGKIDGITQSCTSACGMGTETCTAGKWSACSAKSPVTETCNGIDDDCDGKIDGMTQSCSTTCGAGTETCTAGKWSACSAKMPQAETCNGLDDDCDGKIDGMSQSCSTACGTGTQTCNSGVWSACPVKTPQPEVCNGQDDNCNGQADEGLTSTWTFKNLCSSSPIFIVFGGCNVCATTCNGYWVSPGASYTTQFAQNSSTVWSAFAQTSKGNRCLDTDANGSFIGQTRVLSNGDCQPQLFTMIVFGGC
jgi:hypothetical protein